jgi:t-SNARE complex subunit (syntaxin)
VGVLVVWALVNTSSVEHFEQTKEHLEIIEPAQPTEEELRRMEWEKEAEEVKAQHLKKKELEHERSVLLEEVKEREARIKELEKELGF